MSRIRLLLFFMVALTGSWSLPGNAQVFHGPNSAKQAEKANKRQQKALRKAAKKQQKKMRKYQKAQKKASKRRHH